MTYIYIDQNSQLQSLCGYIADHDVIAVDTEFVRRDTYYPILSLIQIAAKGRIYVVDCISSDIDLSSIYDIIANPGIKKIFHSSSQDLEIFYKNSGKKPCNIDDTQILANFCGYDFNCGYSSLVAKFFDIAIDKKMQNSNWLKRPLQDRQIEYATIDVIYLEEIYCELLKIVKEKNLFNFYCQDIEIFTSNLLSQNIAALYKSFAKNLVKSIRINRVPEGLLKKLVTWRDNAAKKLNIPRRNVVGDDKLLSLAIKGHVEDDLYLDQDMTNDLKSVLKNYDNSLDLEEKSYIIEPSKDDLNKAKKELSEIAAYYGLKEQFIISVANLKLAIAGAQDRVDFTDWRSKIIEKIKFKIKDER